MTTADYALIISLCSATISLASLVWNVWSKFIYPKGNVKVSFQDVKVLGAHLDPANPPRFLSLSATNHGPSEVTLHLVSTIFRKGWWGHGYALLQPIRSLSEPTESDGPHSGGLPKALKIGDDHAVYFPFEAQSFGRDKLLKIGFADNFGRTHWAPKRDIRAVKAGLERKFGAIPYVP